MRLRKLLEAIECGTSVGIIKKKAGLPDIYITEHCSMARVMMFRIGLQILMFYG